MIYTWCSSTVEEKERNENYPKFMKNADPQDVVIVLAYMYW